MAPFYRWGSTASRLEPLRGGSLLFTTKFPEIAGNASWQYCQKNNPLKGIFQLCKTFLSLLFYFITQVRKTYYRKKWKIEPLKSIYELGNQVLDSSWLNHWNDMCLRSYAWFLNFLSNNEGLNFFSRPKVLPKLSKITVTSPKSVKINK